MPKMQAHDFWPDPEYTRRKDEKRNIKWTESTLDKDMAELRFKFPDFLPADDPRYRHPIMSKLERMDMLRRRQEIDIPEFYVGSIMAVQVSDPNAPGKISRFVGICIAREGYGLRANFTLRNYVEHEGVEIRYDLYNPTIRTIDVLKLEKRLDDRLFYLRDALPEFSTFSFDMEQEVRAPGAEVPLNPIKVTMKPFPWTQHWEVEWPSVRGIDKLANVPDWLAIRSRKSHNKYEKFDLMLEYRTHIPEEDQVQIWDDVKDHEDRNAERRKTEKRKRMLQKPTAKK
jgi:large subunit ribosomal protein L19